MINIDRLAGRLVSLSIKRSKSSSNDLDGALENKLSLATDVSLNIEDIIDAFPGADAVWRAVCADEALGVQMTSKCRLQDVVVTLAGPMGDVFFGPAIMRGSQPKIAMARGGAQATLTIAVTGPLVKEAVVDDFIGADIMISITPAQVDIDDVIAKAAEKRPHRKRVTTEITLPSMED